MGAHSWCLLVSVEPLCVACVFMMSLIPIDLWLLDQVQVFVSVMIGASAVVGVLIDPHTQDGSASLLD